MKKSLLALSLLAFVGLGLASCSPSETTATSVSAPQGDKGDTGQKGPTGDKGPVGDTGPSGSQGLDGQDGSKGPTGDKGPTGETGDKGPDGSDGVDGEKTYSTTVLGNEHGWIDVSVASATVGTDVTYTVHDYDTTDVWQFKSLTLKGEGTIFDVSGITIADENEGELVITDGVEVSGDNYYTVESNAEVIINKVKVSTSDEMKLVAEGKNLAVVVENGVTNNVVFVNETDGDAVIAFVGDDTFTAEQAGTITIKSVGGKVTVESTNVNVSADIKVEVNKGTVNIQNPALTGNKEVSVSADEKNPATVEAISKAKAPITMNNVELKAYTDEEMKTVFGSSITQADMIAIREYIDAFGLNGTGAKITVTKGSTEVKLVIDTNVDKIENLK